MAELTTQHLDKALAANTKALKAHTDDRIDGLARIVAEAFTKQNEYLEQRFDDLARKQVGALKQI
jgi:hypothetical protein